MLSDIGQGFPSISKRSKGAGSQYQLLLLIKVYKRGNKYLIFLKQYCEDL